MRKEVLMLVSLLFSLIGCGRLEREILLSRDKVQENANKRFPYEKDIKIAEVTLDNPNVYFTGTNAGIILDYSTKILKKEVEGKVNFNGELDYRPPKGSFYLKNIVIKEISYKDKSLTDKSIVNKAIQMTLKLLLKVFPVYTLKQDNFKQKLAKYLLKKVSVKGDKLSIIIGIGNK